LCDFVRCIGITSPLDYVMCVIGSMGWLYVCVFYELAPARGRMCDYVCSIMGMARSTVTGVDVFVVVYLKVGIIEL